MFCVLIEEKEIFLVLFFIGDNKVLGVDGFNVYFFKRIWEVNKYDIIVVIKEFFLISKFLKVIKYIYVILIFKVKNFSYVKDFRFIVCCFILYNFIFKVIVNRFMGVLSDFVGDS